MLRRWCIWEWVIIENRVRHRPIWCRSPSICRCRRLRRYLRGMIDWFCWLGILPIKLLFPFNGERALICPVAFVLAVEETERNFLPSTTAVPSSFALSVFAMVTIIAVGSFFVAVPLVFTPVMVSVLSGGFFFGHVVHCSFLLRLVSMPWF